MNRKDENARESLNHFEIAFLLVCYEELKIWDLILTISSSSFFFFSLRTLVGMVVICKAHSHGCSQVYEKFPTH